MDTTNMSLMDIFSNPETVHSLTFGEKMMASTITMILGLGITFMVLLLIWLFISLMGKALGTSKKAAPAPAPAAAPAAVETKAPVEETSDDSLVAVIAAAIAAYQGANANNLVVKKITRLSGDNTPWGVSGLEDRLETRKY